MKRLLGLFALVAAGTACQPQATSSAADAPKLQPTTAVKNSSPTPVVVVDSLTPEMRATLQKVNIASLFLAPEPGHGKNQSVLDGFFGRDPQRLSLAVVRASRDSIHPGLFHVAGKVRYKKQTSCFTGDLQINKIEDYYDQGILLSQGGDDLHYVADSTNANGGYISNARAYSATASLQFSGVAPATYVLKGRMLLDFWLNDKHKIGFMLTPGACELLKKSPTRGSAFVLKGIWQEATTKTEKPFLVSRDIFLLSPDLIADFGVGDRGVQINPKYAKLGWGNYWENDEWWADSPKPSLTL